MVKSQNLQTPKQSQNHFGIATWLYQKQGLFEVEAKINPEKCNSEE